MGEGKKQSDKVTKEHRDMGILDQIIDARSAWRKRNVPDSDLVIRMSRVCFNQLIAEIGRYGVRRQIMRGQGRRAGDNPAAVSMVGTRLFNIAIEESPFSWSLERRE